MKIKNINNKEAEKDITINDVVVASVKSPEEKEKEQKEIKSPESGKETFAPDMKMELTESINELLPVDETELFTYVLERLGYEGFDTGANDVQQYAQSVADYIQYAVDADPTYDFDKWYQDTMMNYPEELAELTKTELTEAVKTKSLWDTVYDNLVADANIDYAKLEVPGLRKIRYNSDAVAVSMVDDALIAYAPSLEGLKFAQKVASYFNLETKITRENHISDPTHAWSIKILIPEEQELDDETI